MADALNWQEINARLERTRRALDPGGGRSPDEAGRILKERALALARPLEEAQTPTEMLDLLIFSLAGERYGIETTHVLEVVSLAGLTPVPCTPEFVLGVVNHRGRVLPILDLRRLLDLTGQGVAAGSRIVAVKSGGMTFGILTDAVVGTIQVAVSELAPPPAALTGDRKAYVRGVTAEMIAVLDLETLTQYPRIVVNEEA